MLVDSNVNKLFITGTDTEVGKTYISLRLLQNFNQQGKTTIGLKPIASGCEQVDSQLHNSDALALQKAASIKLPYKQVNPFAFKPGIAPHIAAKQAGVAISAQAISDFIKTSPKADITIIEGAGGWQLPLNHSQCLSEVIGELKIPTILVIGLKLGCINHALLTVDAIANSGAPLLGWIGNCINPDMDVQNENIESLKAMIKAPCLGIMAYKSDSLLSLAVKTV